MASGQKPAVSYLGPTASYSHQAVRQMFPEESWTLEPVYTIDDVFEQVQSGSTKVGVVPFENSTNGSVVFTLDDLADRAGIFPDITVVGEIFVDVHHFLVGHFPSEPSSAAVVSPDGSGTCTPTAYDPAPLKPRAKPLCSLQHVKRLYSHPQAFGQCNAFTAAYLRGVEVFEVSSTSKAAEIVAADETGTWAAISSELAAEMHPVDVLAKSIEDRKDNTTRFLVISTDTKIQDSWDVRRRVPPAGEGGLGSKSMISFTVPHSAPGALAEALSCFKAFEVNLTSINSRPSLEKPFHYLFFVEFEGKRGEERVEGALEKVGRVAESWRWLGSWERYR
ncbi:hypothetical protein NLU13_6087 [Sarocladium strictum]|uniref:prephenate dehydratase n=1 Tax=Sarocladium strictum TaxID=5046 RepID=A0AA39GF86_SARSR|nr:hypothetical protein NLU13_6087 [Sarocladium strictum]